MKLLFLISVFTIIANLVLSLRTCKPKTPPIVEPADPPAVPFTKLTSDDYSDLSLLYIILSFGADQVVANGADTGKFPDRTQFYAVFPEEEDESNSLSNQIIGNNINYKFDSISILQDVDMHIIPEFSIKATYIVNYQPSTGDMKVTWFKYNVYYNESSLPYSEVDSKEITTNQEIQDELAAGVAQTLPMYEENVGISDDEHKPRLKFIVKEVVSVLRQVRSDGTSYQFTVVLKKSNGGEATIRFGTNVYEEFYWNYEDDDVSFSEDGGTGYY